MASLRLFLFGAVRDAGAKAEYRPDPHCVDTITVSGDASSEREIDKASDPSPSTGHVENVAG